MAETKTEGQKLKEKLLVKRKNGWEDLSEAEKKKVLKLLKKLNHIQKFWLMATIFTLSQTLMQDLAMKITTTKQA